MPHALTMPVSLLVIVTISAIWSYVDCHDPSLWWLEALPALLIAFTCITSYHRFTLTGLSYLLLTVHCLILFIGAHYTYAEVPAFNWLQDALGHTRNNYDKLGHLAQGFVPAIILREMLLRTSSLTRGGWLNAIIIFCCLGGSAIYELIEWAIAVSGHEATEDFLGTQGDAWDTQKDMLCAGIGASLALLCLGRQHDNALRQCNA